MTEILSEHSPLIKDSEELYLPEPVPIDDEPSEWRNRPNDSLLFPLDAHMFSSFAEMRSSMLESCCPGDGILSGTMSLITTAATPSMLSLPLAFVVGGWWFAWLSILFCVVVTFLSVRILAVASISADSDDYETVAGFFLGRKGRWTLRVIMFLYSLGSGIVYLCFIKDSITPILTQRASFLPEWLQSEIGSSFFLILSMLVITPLTFNSRLASLRTKGFVSNLIILFIIFAVIYRYYVPAVFDEDYDTMNTQMASKHTHTNYHAMHHHHQQQLQGVKKGKSNFFANTNNGTSQSGSEMSNAVIEGPFHNTIVAFLLPYMFVAPIFVFSYEVQSNVMAVIKDLQDRTGERILASISLALLCVSLFYVVLGIFGSLTFPYLQNGNILSSYNVKEDNLMALCQLLCCFSAAISYVFCIFPCRQSAFMFFSDGITTKVPPNMRVKLGIALSVISVLFAVVLPDVAEVVSVLGALFSATICMTFPALFALCMHRSCTYLTSSVDFYLSWGLLIFGILFSIGGTVLSIIFTI